MNKLQQLMTDWEAQWQIPNVLEYSDISTIIHNSDALALLWLAKKCNISPTKIKLVNLLWAYEFKTILKPSEYNTLIGQFLTLPNDNDSFLGEWLVGTINNNINGMMAYGHSTERIKDFREKGKIIAKTILSMEIIDKIFKLIK